MTEVNATINATADFTRSEPEPTRPTWGMAVGLAALVGVAQVASHWQEITAFLHLS